MIAVESIRQIMFLFVLFLSAASRAAHNNPESGNIRGRSALGWLANNGVIS
jgi:hypothetical protein